MSTEIAQWVLERSPYRGVTRAVHLILAELAEEGGGCQVTTVGLGKLAGVRRHSVTAAMRQLVRDGFLELAGPPNHSHSPTCCRVLTPGSKPAHGRSPSMSHGRSPSMSELSHVRPASMSDPQKPRTNLAPDPDPDPNRILPSAEDSGWLWGGMGGDTPRVNGAAPAKEAKKAPRRRPEIPFPPDLTLTPKLALYAERNGLDAEYEWGKFRVHALQDDRRHVDWVSAWGYWCRNAWEMAHRRRAR